MERGEGSEVRRRGNRTDAPPPLGIRQRGGLNLGYCWAEALGDCAGPITGEHIVSRAVFTDERVTVQGFRWCKDEPAQIGLNSLTANVLCARHNNGSHQLDDAAGAAMHVFRQALKIAEGNRKLMPWVTPKVQRMTIDAGLLERWMLKTTLNLKHGSLLQEGRPRVRNAAATLEEAELCFGRRAFEGYSGMYVAYSKGAKLNLLDRVLIATMIDTHADDELVATRFELHGFRFVLNLRADSPLPPLESVPGMDAEWRGSFLSRRFKHARFNHLSWASHYLDFDWSAADALRQKINDETPGAKEATTG